MKKTEQDFQQEIMELYYIIMREDGMYYFGRDSARYIRLGYDIKNAREFKKENRCELIANLLSARSSYKYSVVRLKKESQFLPQPLPPGAIYTPPGFMAVTDEITNEVKYIISYAADKS